MLNIQLKYNKDGVLLGRGIEWTDYTWNVIGGCLHRCRWHMPDGSVARCYAEAVAEGVARAAYPHGFAHHYHHPGRLREPLTLAKPSKIFLDSMSDLGGAWVPAEQRSAVLDVVAEASHHSFQMLTKAPTRIRDLILPPNLWAGVSSPPDEFMGTTLTQAGKERQLHAGLNVLSGLNVPVRWMSFEPVSWDVAEIVSRYPGALTWAVIGAATNGRKVYQPDPGLVRNLLAVLDEQKVPVFFKGNLEGNDAAQVWREFFPGYEPSEWNKAPLPAWVSHPSSYVQAPLI